eukprot:UC1_evm1s461
MEANSTGLSLPRHPSSRATVRRKKRVEYDFDEKDTMPVLATALDEDIGLNIGGGGGDVGDQWSDTGGSSWGGADSIDSGGGGLSLRMHHSVRRNKRDQALTGHGEGLHALSSTPPAVAAPPKPSRPRHVPAELLQNGGSLKMERTGTLRIVKHKASPSRGSISLSPQAAALAVRQQQQQRQQQRQSTIRRNGSSPANRQATMRKKTTTTTPSATSSSGSDYGWLNSAKRWWNGNGRPEASEA